MASIGGQQVGIWTPALALPEATSVQITDHYLKLYPYPQSNDYAGSTVLMLQHYIVTLGQPNLNYIDYPDDIQTISFRFFSFALTSIQLNLVPSNPPVTLFLDAAGVPALDQNPLWTYIDSGATFDDNLFNEHFGKSSHIAIMLDWHKKITCMCCVPTLHCCSAPSSPSRDLFRYYHRSATVDWCSDATRATNAAIGRSSRGRLLGRSSR
jgi:hypothetical protein